MPKSKNRTRVNNSNSNRRLRSEIHYLNNLPTVDLTKPIDLTVFEDRRTFHPMGDVRPARSFNKSQHTLTLDKNVNKPVKGKLFDYYQPSNQITFSDSKNVIVCVRRKIRQEVLHALQKTGKAGQRPPRRNFFSTIKC